MIKETNWSRHLCDYLKKYPTTHTAPSFLTPAPVPPLPKAFLVVNPPDSEPYGLFTAKQMIEYYNSGRASG